MRKKTKETKGLEPFSDVALARETLGSLRMLEDRYGTGPLHPKALAVSRADDAFTCVAVGSTPRGWVTAVHHQRTGQRMNLYPTLWHQIEAIDLTEVYTGFREVFAVSPALPLMASRKHNDATVGLAYRTLLGLLTSARDFGFAQADFLASLVADAASSSTSRAAPGSFGPAPVLPGTFDPDHRLAGEMGLARWAVPEWNGCGEIKEGLRVGVIVEAMQELGLLAVPPVGAGPGEPH